MDRTSEYDQRQYRLMKDRVDAFLAGKLSLGKTVNDLDALLNVLEHGDEHWKESFLHYWGQLEDIRAVRMEPSFKVVSTDQTRHATEAATALQSLIIEKLSGTGSTVSA